VLVGGQINNHKTVTRADPWYAGTAGSPRTQIWHWEQP
jgi:hypothetical protein